jgi:hypothetical protein
VQGLYNHIGEIVEKVVGTFLACGGMCTFI